MTVRDIFDLLANVKFNVMLLIVWGKVLVSAHSTSSPLNDVFAVNVSEEMRKFSALLTTDPTNLLSMEPIGVPSSANTKLTPRSAIVQRICSELIVQLSTITSSGQTGLCGKSLNTGGWETVNDVEEYLEAYIIMIATNMLHEPRATARQDEAYHEDTAAS